MTSDTSTTTPPTAVVDPASPSQQDGEGSGAQAVLTRVADEAPAQAARVVEDARTQMTTAAHRTLADLRTQADDRAARAAHGLHGLSAQVDALAAGRPEDAGPLVDMVQAVGQQAAAFADRLDQRGVQGVTDDIARFGRQRPWAFLGLSLGAGFLVGRLIRTSATVIGEEQTNRQSSASHMGELPDARAVTTAAPTTKITSSSSVGR